MGTYYRVNPSLQHCVPNDNLNEPERILITRFRTGSHSLAIELGRFSNRNREDKLCCCRQGVGRVYKLFGTYLWNVHLLTRDLVCTDYQSVKDIFEDRDLKHLLLRITKRLKIPL